jgi:hypothetical protein
VRHDEAKIIHSCDTVVAAVVHSILGDLQNSLLRLESSSMLNVLQCPWLAVIKEVLGKYKPS